MNNYLLLRDNKQSGPYTVEELATHGLKPYDLVWLEGKSAAWRYPSEIEELKPFAPVVEEQPFDRFYKKPESKTIEPAVKDNTHVKENRFIPDQLKNHEPNSSKQKVELSKGSKKIHVSLPGANLIDPSINKSPREENKTLPRQVVQSVEKTKEVSRLALNDEPALNTSNKLDSSTAIQATFKEANGKTKQKTQSVNSPSSKEAPVSKLLFRSVAAACLLLGGALIGLVINYNNQQKKFQQLNQLVQEIKHQENPGTSKAVKSNLSNEVTIPKAEIKDQNQPVEQPLYKEDIQLPPAKNDRRNSKSLKENDDSLSPVQETPEVVPAVLPNEEPVHKIDKVASDLAKKNLWKLVLVEPNTYKTGVFGGISNLSLKLSNKSLFQLQQVEVEVLFLSPEKKTVNKQKVVFENVSPGEQLSVEVPKSSRGVKIDYTIKKISTKEFELAHAGM